MGNIPNQDHHSIAQQTKKMINLKTTTITLLSFLYALMAQAAPSQRDGSLANRDLVKLTRGCYLDKEDDRLLPDRPKTFIAHDKLTKEACNAACVQEGYNSAGVENGKSKISL
jgi:hypothetical protein